MVGHRLMGISSLCTGDIADGRAHCDQAIALYDPAKHRPLATRFGQDIRVAILSFRSIALWMLGYPEAALADVDQALKDAREIGQAATLMYALALTSLTHLLCGNYAAANAQADELVALAEEKGALFWKAWGRTVQGCVLAVTGKASDAVHHDHLRDRCMPINGSNSLVADCGYHIWRKPMRNLANSMMLGAASAKRSMAVETTKERWCEAEVNRIAGEIALKSPRTGCGESGSVFRARARGRTPATSKILGTPRRHEPRAPLA